MGAYTLCSTMMSDLQINNGRQSVVLTGGGDDGDSLQLRQVGGKSEIQSHHADKSKDLQRA